MRYLFACLSHFIFAHHLATSSSYAIQSTLRRENNYNHSFQPSSSVTPTTVLSSDDADLTISFNTLIYYSPLFFTSNSSDLAHISPRQTSASSRRPVNFCQSPTASFLTSYCKYSHGHYVPLQDYTVFCEEDPPQQHQQSSTSSASANPSSTSAPHQFSFQHHHHLLPSVVTEDGACNQDEICVDGELGEGVAYCVNKSEFGLLKQLRDEPDSGGGQSSGDRSSSTQRSKGNGADDGWIKVRRKGRLGGKMARMVISGQEGVMPMKVGGMDRKAGILGDSTKMIDSGGQDAVVSQERRCQGCFELRSGIMGDETNFLETEARVMTGGSIAAAAAGVVWLMVSG